jgi:hypothetical protein
MELLVNMQNLPQWYGSQLKFIRNHRYFTASARQLCDAQKQINVAAMAALLRSAGDGPDGTTIS